jgi:hypothetical protein
MPPKKESARNSDVDLLEGAPTHDDAEGRTPRPTRHPQHRTLVEFAVAHEDLHVVCEYRAGGTLVREAGVLRRQGADWAFVRGARFCTGIPEVRAHTGNDEWLQFPLPGCEYTAWGTATDYVRSRQQSATNAETAASVLAAATAERKLAECASELERLRKRDEARKKDEKQRDEATESRKRQEGFTPEVLQQILGEVLAPFKPSKHAEPEGDGENMFDPTDVRTFGTYATMGEVGFDVLEMKLRTHYGPDRAGMAKWGAEKEAALRDVMGWLRAASVVSEWERTPEIVMNGTSALTKLREWHARDLGLDVHVLRAAVAKAQAKAKGDAFAEAVAAQLQVRGRGRGGRGGGSGGRGGRGERKLLCLVCGAEGHTAFDCDKADKAAKSALAGSNRRGGRKQ